jgi:subtilase family serine protease
VKLHLSKRLFTLCFLLLLLTACSPLGSSSGNGNATPTATTGKTVSHPTSAPTLSATGTLPTQIDTCPALAGFPSAGTYCYTPHQLRVAYGVESLIEHGYTGKGQTVVDIVSFGSPTLQQDMNAYDQQFGLPPITIQVFNPLGTVPFDPNNTDMQGWVGETELDVQIIHAIAPDAGIVVLTSPVSETEGTIGLPQFLQLEQYAISHRLGNIVSQSWGASEVTLKDTAGQQELQKWNTFYQQSTTQQGMTYFSSSGDNGATDYTDLKATKLSTVATTSFPADEPWVTSVGGTTVVRNGSTIQESVWNSNNGAGGGGFSNFYPTPSFQQTLPTAVQVQFNHRRGVPDVAADADPSTGLVIYLNGQWTLAGGTSAAAPLWAGLMAIADQMAGHPLGFINPTLYKLANSSRYAQDFHDITSGNNTYVGKGVDVHGYAATVGWDAASGLGTPDAENLLPDLVAALK